MSDQQDIKTYRGNCHCKAYVFEAKLPEIKKVDRCSCSICYKKGALWVFPKRNDVTWVKGEESTLKTYNFGRKRFDHKFCPTCGTSILGVGYIEPPKPGEDKEPEFCLNARTIQGLDIWSLEERVFDGGSIPPAYEPPQFTGTEPQAELEGGKLFYGSCHCGAVRLALKSPPLDETYDDRVIECNCSICGRYGTTWIYPKKEYVAVEGEDNMTYYGMGMGIFLKGFCKTCGVPVENKATELSDEKIAALPEGARFWHARGKTFRSLNGKVLNGVDLGPLKKERIDGWKLIKPEYVNP
ncbi:hypothetical protein JX265_003469 [Neoarthrinium moseri]|uniref:CENP-V/GFA domain-containing protein n=1 Tax=Neoarthrinium moseri TaxID=1658444 RepID=A0A9Q0AT23_9PEZI|nr:hypothetical protein JX266_004475 [Neoarthrinium moseri]KAI1877461.1 hypothetical protein JX265_003469 [Neoarthrinium moseri]